MNNEICPQCGKSHYTLGQGFTTLMNFTPEYKDGVNINPDRNTTTYTLTCMECGKEWQVKK